VRKVIDLLRTAHSLIDGLCGQNEDEKRWLDEALLYIGHALVILKAPPRHYTPEQWKERTGEEWPDMNAVYVQAYKDYQGTGGWEPQYEWGVALHCEVKGLRFTIICATEAGKPSDDWVPEGTQ
jgi:hypothetical protein